MELFPHGNKIKLAVWVWRVEATISKKYSVIFYVESAELIGFSDTLPSVEEPTIEESMSMNEAEVVSILQQQQQASQPSAFKSVLYHVA